MSFTGSAARRGSRGFQELSALRISAAAAERGQVAVLVQVRALSQCRCGSLEGGRGLSEGGCSQLFPTVSHRSWEGAFPLSQRDRKGRKGPMGGKCISRSPIPVTVISFSDYSIFFQ